MLKYLIFIILFPLSLTSQERNLVAVYGEFGFGLSNSNFPSSNSGINSNLSVSVETNKWLLRLTHKVNGVFSFSHQKDKLRSTDLLVGRSLNLYTEHSSEKATSSVWNIIFYLGFSALQNQSYLTTNSNGSSFTRLKIESGYGIPIEVEIQRLFPRYFGGALTFFYNINKFRNFYGVSISGVLGSF